MKTLISIKEEITKIALKSYNLELVAGTSGNLSYFDRNTGYMYITPSNISYTEMTKDDIMVITLEGEVIEGVHKPSSEWLLHAEMYKGKENVNAVIHTHSPYATGFSIVKKGVPLVLVEMLPFLGGDIPVADFGMPSTSEIGVNAIKVMKNRNAAILQNHGVVAVGQSVEQAFIRAVYVEDAAKAFHFAKLVGEPIIIPSDIQNVLRKKYNLEIE